MHGLILPHALCKYRLEVESDSSVDLSSCQVVGHGVLRVGDVGDPIVGIDIVDPEQIEAVDAQPDVLKHFAEATRDMSILVLKQSIAHANVYSLVGRSTQCLF